MGKMITVGMADLKVCRAPDNLTTLGLGSCVGVALYDPATMVSGMLHCMLPDSTRITNQQNIAKFADTGLDELVKQMMSIGAMRSRLVAKIAGGAQMFAFSSGNDMMRVGDRNVEAVKAKLMQMRIRLLAEDTGKHYGRTIEFYSETGKLFIKSVGKEKKYI